MFGPDEIKLLENIHAALEETSIGILKPLMFNRMRLLNAINDIDEQIKALRAKWGEGQEALEQKVHHRMNAPEMYKDENNKTMWNIVYDQVLEKEYEFSLEQLFESYETAVRCRYQPVRLFIYARHLNTFDNGTEFLKKELSDNFYVEISGHKIRIVLCPENKPMPFKGASFECLRLNVDESTLPA